MMEASRKKAVPQPAVVLLGPTGSGKSPLGEALEGCGLRGRRCAHFDFGAHLRRAASDPAFARGCGLNAHELKRVDAVLLRGALLEDGDFSVALKLLDAFMTAHALDEESDLILNGLPRHIGQARMLSDRLRVREMVVLACDADVVIARIQSNAGGDRVGRDDDHAAEVRRRIKLFIDRTVPLEAYYASRGARITRLEVGPDTKAVDLIGALNTGEPS